MENLVSIPGKSLKFPRVFHETMDAKGLLNVRKMSASIQQCPVGFFSLSV